MKKKALRIVHSFILWYAFVGGILLPFYFSLQQKYALFRNHELAVVMNVLDLFLMISLFYFILALLFNAPFRRVFVSRLAGIRERDEREEYVTGRALRTAFLLMIAFEIIIIILTMLQIDVNPLPDGHHQLIMGIGLVTGTHFDILQRSAHAAYSSVLPANYCGLVIILLAIQLVLFRIFSRKYYKM
jgi:predicted neutral ceramidase superfamily lipid hydrolase